MNKDQIGNYPDLHVVIYFGIDYWQIGYRNDTGTWIELKNQIGETKTPNCIAYNNDGFVLGTLALIGYDENLSNTVFNLDKLIGQGLSDYQKIFSNNELVEFKESNEILFILKNDLNTIMISPEQLVSEFIKQMFSLARCQLNEHQAKLTIIIPAHFNNCQRCLVKKALEMANLEIESTEMISDLLAFDRGYYDINPTQKLELKNSLIIDFESSSTNIVLLYENEEKLILNDTLISGNTLAELFNHAQQQFFPGDTVKLNPKEFISDAKYNIYEYLEIHSFQVNY
ncbi:uncharacterized protein SAPINGB_P000089 [Magnusiomyces paraingens]|uniref:Uncharacterized protein n=1 Tax=Magnusiomyces paraingens TaxID=2606893 RepID=A0A5E8AXH6_9ASCO|nr:uncharacterized protein SAPINGB_P000089 [Saprochaete ingens]VVT43666.1 unnamed protein product [Saprochaete ingens]